MKIDYTLLHLDVMKKRHEIELEQIKYISSLKISEMIGVSPPLFNELLRGQRNPSYETLLKFCAFTGEKTTKYIIEDEKPT
jgi:transcriptional regulator with XRE-family HTH domain